MCHLLGDSFQEPGDGQGVAVLDAAVAAVEEFEVDPFVRYAGRRE
jgi:hypothetical protein